MEKEEREQGVCDSSVENLDKCLILTWFIIDHQNVKDIGDDLQVAICSANDIYLDLYFC